MSGPRPAEAASTKVKELIKNADTSRTEASVQPQASESAAEKTPEEN